MTILVHGAFGFVGSHLVKRLRADGHEVVTIGRAPYEIKWRRFDAIVNCAAELTDEDQMFASNVNLCHDLLKLTRGGLATKMIQIGSSSEYGLMNAPRIESAACIPSNIYESTKLAATSLCLGFAARFDMDICIARPFSLFGPNDKPRKLIPTLYRSHLDHKTIDLHDGSHDWLYIDDFIDGIVTLLNSGRELTKGDIINFGTGVSSTNHQVVEGLESALGSKLDVRHQYGRYHAHDVDNWVADATKAREKYGWKPRHDLASGLKAYVMAEWFNTQTGDQG